MQQGEGGKQLATARSHRIHEMHKEGALVTQLMIHFLSIKFKENEEVDEIGGGGGGGGGGGSGKKKRSTCMSLIDNSGDFFLRISTHTGFLRQHKVSSLSAPLPLALLAPHPCSSFSFLS